MSTRAFSVADLLAHRRWLHRLAVQIVRDDDLARDLVQDTWLAAMRGSGPSDDKVRPWLAGVLRNLARMNLRTAVRRRGRETVTVEGEEESALPSPEELLARVEAQELLVDEVRRLDEPYRTTILLLYFEGLPAADVARRLSIPDSTVRWRHRQALDDLRRALAEKDPQRRRMRALLMPAGYAAAVAVESGAGVLGGKGLWAGLALMLASLLSLWPGGEPAPSARPGAPPQRALRLSSAPSVTVSGELPPGARVVLPGSGAELIQPRRSPARPAARSAAPALADPEAERPRVPRPVSPSRLPVFDDSLPLPGPTAGDPGGRIRCTTAQLLTRNLNHLNKELSMKLTSPRLHAMVAAMIGALQQGGCTSGPSSGGSDSLDDEIQSPDGSDRGSEGGGDDEDDRACRDACDGAAGSGVYVGMRCAGEALFDMVDDLSCDDARERCERVAAESPDESIYCEWNGTEVFRHEAEAGTCSSFGPAPDRNCHPPPADSCNHPCGASGVGRYRGFYCGPDDHNFIGTDDIDCQAALGNCLLNAALNPDLSFFCEWNGKEIYRREVEAGACNAKHGPPALTCTAPPPDCAPFHPCGEGGTGTYRGAFCGEQEFIRTENIDCQAALGNCGLNAMLNADESIRCEWNGEEIYRREVEAGSCDAYGPVCGTLPSCSDPCAGASGAAAYVATSCDIPGAIDAAEVTCQEARERCAQSAAEDPAQNVVCIWDDVEIFRRDAGSACDVFPRRCAP